MNEKKIIIKIYIICHSYLNSFFSLSLSFSLIICLFVKYLFCLLNIIRRPKIFYLYRKICMSLFVECIDLVDQCNSLVVQIRTGAPKFAHAYVCAKECFYSLLSLYPFAVYFRVLNMYSQWANSVVFSVSFWFGLTIYYHHRYENNEKMLINH